MHNIYHNNTEIEMRQSNLIIFSQTHFAYLQTLSAMVLLLPWKLHRWHLTHIELVKCNRSAIKCRCIL